MLEIERHNLIIKETFNRKFVNVRELAELMNVTEQTIRRDLNKLQKKGYIKRVRGGATLINGNTLKEKFSYKDSSMKNINEKKLIAEKAAKLIKNDMIVALSTSTIASLIAERINAENVSIITNSLDIANICSEMNNIVLFLTGGVFYKNFRAFEGITTIEQFKEYNYDISFIGTNAISIESGISTSTEVESISKRTIIKNSAESYIIAEHQKFNKRSRNKICFFDEIDGIITDDINNQNVINFKKVTKIL